MRKTPVHPFLIAAFPVLSLWSANADQVQLADVAVALVASAAIAWIAVRAAGAIVDGRARAAAAAAVWLLVFSSYGHLARVLETWHVGSIELSRLPFVVAIAAAIGAGATLAVRAARGWERVLTRALTVVGVALVAITVVEIAASRHAVVAVERGAARLPDRGDAAGAALPDVYYVVLDGYASDGTLRDVYGFDNSDFTGYLRGKGFYVADASRSNYPMTALSLASSLNMRYVDDEARRNERRPSDRAPLTQMIRDNEVLRTFRGLGYRTVHVGSGWDATERNERAEINLPCGRLSDYTTTLIRSTFIGPIDRLAGATAYVHPKRITCEIETLAQVRDTGRPTFVFAHVLAPHPPFVFGPNGEWLAEPGTVDTAVNAWGDRRKYADEIRVINRDIRAALEQMLRGAPRPVVVILQGDHGPASLDEWRHPSDTFLRERLTILNAYLVPQGVRAALYPSITPVNSFRALFSRGFGLDLPLLDDRSYFATYDRPFTLTDVTGRLPR